jgi:hypothetical protein
MTRAVNMCIMSLLGRILYVSGGNRDTTFSLFRSLVDMGEIDEGVSCDSVGQNVGDRCCQSSFAVVDMSDGSNVAMRFASVIMLLCHLNNPP